MSYFDPIRDCPHGRQKGKCDSCELEQAADLLEQQAAEIEALKAHVERLRDSALSAICIMPSGNEKADLRDAYDETPQQSLAERDAEVARKAVEEYKRSITEPNAIVHRYPVVDLSGIYLPDANGRVAMMFGDIENTESSRQSALIKCVIGRLLDMLDEIQISSGKE